jgi:hypothetical protein
MMEQPQPEWGYRRPQGGVLELGPSLHHWVGTTSYITRKLSSEVETARAAVLTRLGELNHRSLDLEVGTSLGSRSVRIVRT